MATANNNSDALNIFETASSTSAQSSTANSAFSQFDPLSSPSRQEPKSTVSNELDLMSQIAGWGAENKTAETESKKEERDVQEQPRKSVMITKEDAVELSDDLVNQAHKEFEATEEQLKKFEKDSRQ